MATDKEKLEQLVHFLAEVHNVLDGGWQYSSPLIRARRIAGGNPSFLVDESDCLSIVAQVVSDIDRASDKLDALATQATELNVDTRSLCGADLPLLAKTYKALAIAIGNAANDAIDALATATPAAKERRPRKTKVAQTDNQTSLLGSEPEGTVQ